MRKLRNSKAKTKIWKLLNPIQGLIIKDEWYVKLASTYIRLLPLRENSDYASTPKNQTGKNQTQRETSTKSKKIQWESSIRISINLSSTIKNDSQQ